MVDFGFKCLWEQKQKKGGGGSNGDRREGAMERNHEGWREVGINREKERRGGSSREVEGDRAQWRGWSRDGER